MYNLKISVLVILILISSFAFAQQGKKILFIDSYHAGYAWSDGITEGIQMVVKPSGADLKIHRLDTKRNGSEAFKKQAAVKAKRLIENYKPDVVIAADDNASKYIIKEYFKNSDIPFVFCGVNWDEKVYGFPYQNTTGMVEVGLYNALITNLKKYSKGSRVGFISSDTPSSHKEGENSTKLLGVKYEKVVYAKTFDDWKTKLLDLQKSVDMIVFENNAGIKGWDDQKAKEFLVSNIAVPTGSIYDWMADFVLISFAKSSQEQGAWAASAALKILSGIKPTDIPVEKNKQGKLFVNMKHAEKLGVTFDLSMLKNAEIIK